MDKKIEFRRAIRERLQHLSARDRQTESRVLCRNLRKTLGEIPTIIAAFLPYTDEPDITPLLTELLAENWTIAMPKLKNNHLIFRIICSLQEVSRNPVTGIPEPADDCPEADESAIAFAIVPGRAFTATGERIGRGNGGYDLWIGKQRSTKAPTRYIGVCFECQIVPELPTEEHDQKMDEVVTSRGSLMKE